MAIFWGTCSNYLMNGSRWKDDSWHTNAVMCRLQRGIKINPLIA
jgi:hypothetical protein